MNRTSISGLLLALGLGAAAAQAAPAKAAPAKPASASTADCPALSDFLQRLGEGVPELGGEVFDDDDSPVEALGSSECPQTSATKCEKVRYASFMLGLMDMSPQTYRRQGIAAFLANVFAEDASFGDQCSAERLSYSGDTLRKIFASSLPTYFCGSKAASYSTAVKAGIVQSEGQCDFSDAGLDQLKNAVMAEAPKALAAVPEYNARLGPIVARIYRHKMGLDSDLDAFRYRGRGFIQITGIDNYKDCQADVAQAQAWLAGHADVAAKVQRATGVAWKDVDVVAQPQLVSSNRYVGAFCAASYWTRKSAQKELSWLQDTEAFYAVVRTINQDKAMGPARYPQYQSWCHTMACQKNYPPAMAFDRGFQALLDLQ